MMLLMLDDYMLDGYILDDYLLNDGVVDTWIFVIYLEVF